MLVKIGEHQGLCVCSFRCCESTMLINLAMRDARLGANFEVEIPQATDPGFTLEDGARGPTVAQISPESPLLLDIQVGWKLHSVGKRPKTDTHKMNSQATMPRTTTLRSVVTGRSILRFRTQIWKNCWPASSPLAANSGCQCGNKAAADSPPVASGSERPHALVLRCQSCILTTSHVL